MLFKWKDSFSVEVISIDEQHKRLFELGSRVFTLLKKNYSMDSYDKIIVILEELKDYTIYHFGYEENLLKENNYSDFVVHKKQHDAFIEKIDEFLALDIDNNQKEVTMEIIEFIADWITKHILKVDKKYSPLLLENKVL